MTRADAIVFTGGTNLLTGTGTVGSFTMISGSTFAPGSGAPGTSMTVAGNLAFQSGAFYLVQLGASSASMANVTGTATVAGTVQFALNGGSVRTRYDILHAGGGLIGTFGGVSNPNFSASLSYTATDVFLTLSAAALGAGTPLNQNQQNVANAINGFFNNGGTLSPNFVNLFGLTGGNLANALTLISGEAATGAQQGAFQLMNQFLGIMLDPFVDGRSGVGGAGGPALGFAPDRPDLPDEIAGWPVAGITPYAAAQAQNFRTPTYNEVDVTAGGFGLTYNSRTGTDTRSELGSRFDYVAALYRDAVLTLRGRLAWAHDWVSDATLSPVFQTLPGASFIVNGATPAKNSALPPLAQGCDMPTASRSSPNSTASSPTTRRPMPAPARSATHGRTRCPSA